VITGVHALVFSKDAEAVRAFFRDVLGLPSVDAGGGWLIFALPPAELAAPVTEQGFGRMTRLKLPGGGELGLYEPRHPTAIEA
jgi:catechol 2,3-dioxygenase-like lactoylglutathione lyase family enzyme